MKQALLMTRVTMFVSVMAIGYLYLADLGRLPFLLGTAVSCLICMLMLIVDGAIVKKIERKPKKRSVRKIEPVELSDFDFELTNLRRVI